MKVVIILGILSIFAYAGILAYPADSVEIVPLKDDTTEPDNGTTAAELASDDTDDLSDSETIGFGYYPRFYGGYGHHYGPRYGGYRGYGYGYGYGYRHGYGHHGYGGYYRRPIYPVWG